MLHLCLLRQLQGVLYLDAKVANRALELHVAQQQLHSAQILGPPIDQRRLGAADGMCSVSGRIKTDFLDPGIHNPSVLSGAQMRGRVNAAWEEKVIRRKTCCLIQLVKAIRVDSVISNCTGLEVFCCTTIARAAIRSP